MKKLAHPKSEGLVRLTVSQETTAKLVTNGYGNFWIEIESSHGNPTPLLEALAKAGWKFDNTIKLESDNGTISLLVRTGHTRDDEWDDEERKAVIAKARSDLRKVGITNISRVDRGI